MNNENLTMNLECDTTGSILNLNESPHLNDIIPEKISGIYKIINRINGKYYIGSGKDIMGKRGRWFWHKHHLKLNKHRNKHLQFAWNKYGENIWEWIILERCHPDKLFETEQKFLDVCKLNPSTNYNILYNASRPGLGYTHSLETRLKMSNAMKGSNNPMYGKTISKEHREKLIAGIKEKSKGINHYNFGKHLSEETKNKISIAGTGKLRSDETKKNIGKALKGRIFSEEHKRKLSISTSRFKGKLHSNFNPTIHTFKNIKTGEVYSGTRFDFIQTYNIPSGRASKLINGKVKMINKWIKL